MSDLYQRIAQLSPEKRALLAQRNPLSFAQQRLWFLDQWEPGSQSYNVPSATLLTGRLQVAALERSLSEIVKRHEVLRTTFVAVDGQPLQIVSPPQRFALPVVDLGWVAEPERWAVVRRLAQQEAQRPFDLARDRLLRATLLRLSREEHVFLLTFHHIVSDAWSKEVFIGEMVPLYEAFSAGRPSPLPELPIQYADYARWQRQWLQGEVLRTELEYWKRQLDGAPRVLELPTDRPRPAAQSFRGATQSMTLPADTVRALRALASRERATMFMTLLAAFEALLHRYTRQNDIVVGTPIANRNRVETEGLIGFFLNTLVLRTDLSGNPTFGELLGRVREVVLAAHAHQQLPFEKLVDELQQERDLSRQPLFQVMFTHQMARPGGAEAAGLRLSSLELQNETAKFDLTLGAVEGTDEITCFWEYDTDLFDADRVTRLMGHFRLLLEGAVAAPEQRLSELPLLSGAERQELLVGWNDTRVDYSPEASAHQLFEAQVARTPSATAVLFEGERLTFAELNARANRLAHYLRERGVGPESVVGLRLERSPELVVSLLAVLKAGGAYLPLEPNYPPQRLRYMIENAGCRLVLSTGASAEESEAAGAAEVVLLDARRDELAAQSAENPAVVVSPSNAAYVIYTSGSTGRPKGVLVTHGGLANYLRWATERYAVAEGGGAPVHSPLSFDLTVTGLFTPLLAGRSVRLLREEQGAEALVQTLRDEGGYSLVKLTPTHLEMLGQMLSPEEVGRAARALVIGGEALWGKNLSHWQAHAPQTRLVNEYGPTETVVGCCVYEVGEGEEVRGAVPIGRPIANTRMYVLDSRMQPTPVGVAGELYIGGAGLARGYVGRPALTAERFVPHPFSQEPGARLYRTGDLGRWSRAGELEYLGRLDAQVKLRGFRIEPGEVEAVLGMHAGVREAVVLVREDVPGDKRLVAYVVPDKARAPAVGELKSYLADKLPEYMVPSSFTLLDALPLTPNGKVDRRALPAPDRARPEADGAFAAPSTPAEEILADVWARVLNLERVGVHDNFFELGGHSLLATQLVSRVRDAFRVEVPLRSLFAAPTVAGLAACIEETTRAGQGLLPPPIVPVPRGAELPLSFAQQRLWFLHQLSPESASYNLPVAVRLLGQLDVAALEQSLGEIVRRHEVLRTTIADKDGKPAQVISPAEPVTLSVLELGAQSEAERESEAQRYVAEEPLRPFNLSSDLLWRVKLLRLASEEHVLLVTMHHIVSDGWSMGLLIRELGVLYEAFSAGRPSPLPDLSIQYADFAFWQREWLRGEVLESQLAYWKGQLGHSPTVLQLPTDRPRPAVQSSRGGRQELAIAKTQSTALKALSRREGVTLFMTLLAAFKTLLYRYTGQEDVVVGSWIAGRNRREVENLIGFFVNTLVLRTDLSGKPGFREVLGRVRETALGAYAHQDLPFEKLVEELQPKRGMNHQPLSQVMFQVQNAPGLALELPGLKLSDLEPDKHQTNFDLVFVMWEQDGALRGAMDYSTDLFDAGTVARMLGHFQTLLEAIAADPEQPVTRLPLLSEVEERQLLVDWCDTGRDYQSAGGLHELIARQAARTPEAVAVSYERHTLTYAELDRRANRLAHHLRRRGVGPESVVGVYLERSLELVVSLLAVLKAGGAYLPLDPSYPPDRLAFMLENARAPLLLTDPALGSRLVADAPHVTALDAADLIWGVDGPPADGCPAGGVRGENLAYVIYTSGSTGRPKGAMNTHRGIVNRLLWMQDAYRLTADDRVLQKTPCGFDVSVWEFFWPLLVGARLVVARPGGHQDSAYLAEVIEREQVTTAHFVPSMMQAFVEEPGAARCRSLRRVISSGEELGARLAERMLALLDVELHNLYGPTEAAVDVTAWACERGAARQRVPIGRPIANMRVYVLGPEQVPVPPGVAGELYLGGVGLARGYRGRPGLTADRFVPDAVGGEGGGRLYRTGDWGRYLPDGAIEFFGRIDGQVKVRGNRIELGEIEAVLAEHEGVREAVVLARPGAGDEQRLVAYLVPREGGSVASGELRSFLRAKLPEYMVPSRFVLMGALPLTANGKLDRRALPDPDWTRPEPGRAYAAPRTPVEEELARLWRELLRVEQVGIYDNFFELGGHSLLLTQLASRIRSAFHVELPLRILFDVPTIVEMTMAIAEQQVEQEDTAAIAQMLGDLSQLSPDEVRALLAAEGQSP